MRKKWKKNSFFFQNSTIQIYTRLLCERVEFFLETLIAWIERL